MERWLLEYLLAAFYVMEEREAYGPNGGGYIEGWSAYADIGLEIEAEIDSLEGVRNHGIQG